MKNAQTQMRSRWLRLVALALLLPLVGACGVGGVQETAFSYGMMGPEGGTVVVGLFSLTVPPGALTEETAVAVFPETNDIPIVPPPVDPGTYALQLGLQWCCGPTGQPLQKDALLVVGYEEAVAPLDHHEQTEMCLLLWDHALQALVPAGDDAVHDPEARTFTVSQYRTLGHVALGTHTVPQETDFAFLAYVALNGERREDTNQLVAEEPYESGLYVARPDGSIPLEFLPTDGELPMSFIPSPDGQRVLFDIFAYGKITQQSGHELFSIGRADPAPTLLAGADEILDGYDPLLGWMRNGQRAFFQEYVPGENDGDGVPEIHQFSTVPGDGSAPAGALYEVGEYTNVNDVRQSPNGALVLIRYWGMYENEEVDVFDANTGVPRSRALIPADGGTTPRFLPDSTGVYLIDPEPEETDGQSAVVRYAPDGTGRTILYTPPEELGWLRDFVIAPNGDDFAFVSYIPQEVLVAKPDTGAGDAAATAPGYDALTVGSFSGGVRESVDLGTVSGVAEMIFHPNGQHVFLEMWGDDPRMFAAADAATGPELHIMSLALLDISATDGRLLLTVLPDNGLSDSIDRTVSPQLVAGIYVAEPDGTNPVAVALPEELRPGPARWMRTIRRAPCMNEGGLFR